MIVWLVLMLWFPLVTLPDVPIKHVESGITADNGYSRPPRIGKKTTPPIVKIVRKDIRSGLGGR